MWRSGTVLSDGLEKAEPVIQGVRTRYTVQLGRIRCQFEPGEKLRITIGGGDCPRIVRTYVDLPVVK